MKKPRRRCPECADRNHILQRADTTHLCLVCAHTWADGRILEDSVVAGTLATLSAQPDVSVWRQNTGALFDRTGRLVRYGVNGAADISGLIRITTKEGTVALGVRLEVECKRPASVNDSGRKLPAGKTSPDQDAFGAMIKSSGGIYIVGDSVDSIIEQLAAAAWDLTS